MVSTVWGGEVVPTVLGGKVVSTVWERIHCCKRRGCSNWGEMVVPTVWRVDVVPDGEAASGVATADRKGGFHIEIKTNHTEKLEVILRDYLQSFTHIE